jgi:hypothetical protein
MTNAWDPLLNHDNDPADHIVGVTDFSTWAREPLYDLLTGISATGITTATERWNDLANRLAGPDGSSGLIGALKSALKPLTNGEWTGDAAHQFGDATGKLVDFAQQLCETARYVETNPMAGVPYYGSAALPVYASLHSVSDRLGQWLALVAQELTQSPLTNSGRSWTDPSVDQNKVNAFDYSESNADWMSFQAGQGEVTFPVYTVVSDYEGDAAVVPAGSLTGSAAYWTHFLNDETTTVMVNDPNEVQGYISKIRKRFLDDQQMKFFRYMADETGKCYRYYYPYVPHPPTWNGFGSGSSNGGGPASMPPFPPFDPSSVGGLSTSDIPGLTNTGLGTGLLPTDGSIISNPDGPTSLAGFTPSLFDPGTLSTPLGGLGGYGGGLSSGLDGLGVGAGGLGAGGLAAGGLDPLAGEEAAAALGANAARPGGMGMYPPMMGGLGAQNQDQERPRASYLVEDEQFWAVEPDRPPSLIGGDE